MRLIGYVLVSVILMACSRTPEPMLYVLTPMSKKMQVPHYSVQTSLLIDEIQLPDYWDRAPMLMFYTNYQGKLDEKNQWAMNPADNIKNVMAQNLSVLMPKTDIALIPVPTFFKPDYHLLVTFNSLQVLDQGRIKAELEYKLYQNHSCLLKRQLSLESKFKPSDWHEAVLTLNQMVNQLSEDIAKNIYPKMQSNPVHESKHD